MPSSELVDAYLSEIAKGYGIDWTPRVPEPPKYEVDELQDDDDGEGGVKVSLTYLLNPFASPQPLIENLTIFSLLRKQEPEKKSLETSVPVKADVISAEARSAGIRTPKLPDVPPTVESSRPSSAAAGATIASDAKASKSQPSPPEDDFEALAKRFEALKRR